jgi:hypothetical protein
MVGPNRHRIEKIRNMSASASTRIDAETNNALGPVGPCAYRDGRAAEKKGQTSLGLED